MNNTQTSNELSIRQRFLKLGCAANAVIFLFLLVGCVLVFSDWFGFLPKMENRPTSDAEVVVPSDVDELAMRAVLATQVAAWNRGDLEGFMAGYSRTDRLTFISGDKITRGWDATRDRYRNRYFTPKPEGKSVERGELSFEELEAQRLSPSVGVIRGRFVQKFRTETATGRFTLILSKSEGGWLIDSDHTSVECR